MPTTTLTALKQKRWRAANFAEQMAGAPPPTESTCTKCEHVEYCKSVVMFTVFQHGEAYVLPCEVDTEYEVEYKPATHHTARRLARHYNKSGRRKVTAEAIA
jgi:hypothetical protein